MLAKRLQILLDDERYERLVARSRETGASVGAVVREAIDLAFPSRSVTKQQALEEILAAAPIAVPDVEELKAELDAARARRA